MKKLKLNKETISKLSHEQLNNIYGAEGVRTYEKECKSGNQAQCDSKWPNCRKPETHGCKSIYHNGTFVEGCICQHA